MTPPDSPSTGLLEYCACCVDAHDQLTVIVTVAGEVTPFRISV